MDRIIVILTVFYTASFILNYGINYAYWSRKWAFITDRTTENILSSTFFAFAGTIISPIGSILFFYLSDFCKYGFTTHTIEWFKLEIELANERKQRRTNYLFFRDDTKNGKVEDFEHRARRIIK